MIRLRDLGRSFWVFLFASCLFTFGVFIFVLLYNLYLLDHGFREDFLGFVASAMTVGNIVGTFLVVTVHRRLGLRGCLLWCFASMALVSAIRALVLGEPALIGFAFVGGMVFSLWAISIPVILAQLTTVEMRQVGFSAYLATVIGMGILADAVAGRLPGWVTAAGTPLESKRAALLIGCGIAALAIWPVSRLRFDAAARPERASYPRGPFITRFVIPLFLLNLGTGAFNPFANTYFAQFLKMPVRTIGLVFSAGQLAQVVAIALAPMIIRRLGQVRGIMAIEVFTGVSLAFLATRPPDAAAALGFAGYQAFQWMDEPAMESLLMTQVQPGERSGASSMMYMVIFAANAIAAPVAGNGLSRLGYPPVIATASCLLMLGGFLFGFLLRGFDPNQQ